MAALEKAFPLFAARNLPSRHVDRRSAQAWSIYAVWRSADRKRLHVEKFEMKTACSLIICLLTFLFGCVETAMMFHGKLVPLSQEIKPIENGVVCRDTLRTFEIVIGYDYVREGKLLTISGQASLAERYPSLYSGVNYLDVYLFFLDENQRVLETVLLARAMTSTLDEILAFDKTLQVPAGAVGVSFGYRGEVTGGSDSERGGGKEIFSVVPFTK